MQPSSANQMHMLKTTYKACRGPLLTYFLLQRCCMLCSLSCECLSNTNAVGSCCHLFNSNVPFTLPFASPNLYQAACKPACIHNVWPNHIVTLVQHAQALIKASFQGVSSDFTSPLQACLKAAQQAPPAPPGGYYAPQWPEQGCQGTSSQLGSISRSTGGSSRSYMMRKRARLGRVR